LCVGE